MIKRLLASSAIIATAICLVLLGGCHSPLDSKTQVRLEIETRNQVMKAGYEVRSTYCLGQSMKCTATVITHRTYDDVEQAYIDCAILERPYRVDCGFPSEV